MLAIAYVCPSMLDAVNGLDVYAWVHELTHALGFVDFLWSQVGVLSDTPGVSRADGMR